MSLPPGSRIVDDSDDAFDNAIEGKPSGLPADAGGAKAVNASTKSFTQSSTQSSNRDNLSHVHVYLPPQEKPHVTLVPAMSSRTLMYHSISLWVLGTWLLGLTLYVGSLGGDREIGPSPNPKPRPSPVINEKLHVTLVYDPKIDSTDRQALELGRIRAGSKQIRETLKNSVFLILPNNDEVLGSDGMNVRSYIEKASSDGGYPVLIVQSASGKVMMHKHVSNKDELIKDINTIRGVRAALEGYRDE